MPTLADIRKKREAGVPLRALGTVGKVANIGTVFGQEDAPKVHKRNHGVTHLTQPVRGLSTPATNPTSLNSMELRRQRAALLELLRSKEWEWEQAPSRVGSMTLCALRTAVCAIEEQMTATSEF